MCPNLDVQLPQACGSTCVVIALSETTWLFSMGQLFLQRLVSFMCMTVWQFRERKDSKQSLPRPRSELTDVPPLPKQANLPASPDVKKGGKGSAHLRGRTTRWAEGRDTVMGQKTMLNLQWSTLCHAQKQWWWLFSWKSRWTCNTPVSEFLEIIVWPQRPE